MSVSKMKQRWLDSEKIAENLAGAATKSEVQDWLINPIRDNGWLELALAGDAETLGKIMNLPEWARIEQSREAAKRQERTEPRLKPKVYQPSDLVRTPTEQVKLAMWFIAKFESPEQALRAVRAAVAATKELEPEKIREHEDG